MSEKRPIETAPKDGTWIILYEEDLYGGPPAEVGRWNAWSGDWEIPDRQAGGAMDCTPTHWAPIP